MQRILAPCTFKFREKASVFLTELHPAPNATARSAILASLRKRDFDATHHCSAFREGAPLKQQGTDDDGEPSGSAGGPMLKVLEGSDLTDVLAVCIRWFGGTKLGTGGLVRAYTQGVQGAIEEAKALGLLETIRILKTGQISVDANLAHLPYSLLGAFPRCEVLGQSMEGHCMHLRFQLPPEDVENFQHAWQERSRGGHVDWEE